MGAGACEERKQKNPPLFTGGMGEINLATTYSRTTYRCTTIGNAVFDGRVRDGIGSDHRFMVTKKLFLKERGCSLKTTHRKRSGFFFQPGAKKPLCY